MNDDRRKLLTKYLGECWHEPTIKTIGAVCSCGKVSYNAKHSIRNRTFTTPDDMMALKDKLVEKGEWDSFESACYMEWDLANNQFDDLSIPQSEFTNWLINPTRFCELVGEWLEGRKG